MTTTPDPAAVAAISKLNNEIAALKTALYSGVNRVSYDGRSVDYADDISLRTRLGLAEQELLKLTNPNYRRKTVHNCVFTNGYRTNNIGYNGRYTL